MLFPANLACLCCVRRAHRRAGMQQQRGFEWPPRAISSTKVGDTATRRQKRLPRAASQTTDQDAFSPQTTDHGLGAYFGWYVTRRPHTLGGKSQAVRSPGLPPPLLQLHPPAKEPRHPSSRRLGLDGEAALGEVDRLLGRALGGGRALALVGLEAGVRTTVRTVGGEAAHLGQSPSDGAGLLRAEVKGKVLLVLVELAEVLTGLLVDDSEDAGDGLADG